MPSPPCFMLSSAPLPPSAVEGRVKEVDVLLIHAILGQAQTFSEAYKMEITSLQMRHSILMESLVA